MSTEGKPSVPTITFTPSICKPTPLNDGTEAPAEYSGEITIRPPTYDERMELYDLAHSDDDDADDDEGGSNDEAQPKPKRKRGKHEFVRKIAPQLPRFFVSSTLKCTADGAEFPTIESMLYDSDMVQVIRETVAVLVRKYRAGNPKSAT